MAQLLPFVISEKSHEVAKRHGLWPVSFADFVCRFANRKRAGVRENTSPIPLKVFERSVRVETVLFCALVGTTNFFLGLFASNPVSTLNALAGLEVLVDLEEVLDFKTVEL